MGPEETLCRLIRLCGVSAAQLLPVFASDLPPLALLRSASQGTLVLGNEAQPDKPTKMHIGFPRLQWAYGCQYVIHG